MAVWFSMKSKKGETRKDSKFASPARPSLIKAKFEWSGTGYPAPAPKASVESAAAESPTTHCAASVLLNCSQFSKAKPSSKSSPPNASSVTTTGKPARALAGLEPTVSPSS